MSSLDDTARKPRYWRSLAELEGKPEFKEFIEREFAAPLEELPPDSPGRRRFVQLMGASLALAGATSCRWEKDYVLPHSRRPEGLVPGEPRVYASAMELGGVAVGLHVQSYDGRPVKIDGNPQHPSSLGAASIYHQASILELYDPDRSQEVKRQDGGRSRSADWEQFDKSLRARVAEAQASNGAGFAVLGRWSSSPTLARLKEKLFGELPQMQWVEYEPLGSDHEGRGTLAAFGQEMRPVFHLERAAVVLSLDADSIGPADPAGLANAQMLAAGRVPDAMTMNRIYVAESSYTLMGTIADHRLSLRASQIKPLAAAIDAKLSAALGAAAGSQPLPAAELLKEPKIARWLDVLVADLRAAGKAALVVVGAGQPPEVHALACRLNTLLGAVGHTVDYLPQATHGRGMAALRKLVEGMAAGDVKTLLIVGSNPVYDAPVDLHFEVALSKVAYSAHSGLYRDETAAQCTWHVPAAHYLEAWSDGVAHDGSLTVGQPLIAPPLYGGRSATQLVASLLGDERDPRFLIRETHRSIDDRQWRKVVHDGVRARAPGASAPPALRPLAPLRFEAHELPARGYHGGPLELVYGGDSHAYDGRFANNAWLQELPAAVTKQAWGNAVLIAPRTARRLGIDDGGLVEVRANGASIQLPAMHAPGQAEGSIKVALGYGRRGAGLVGGSEAEGVEPVGANAYLLRNSRAPFFAQGATVRSLGTKAVLATTQDLHAIDQTGREGINARLGMLVREASLGQYKAKPDFAQHAVHHPALLSLWSDPVKYEGHKWGLAVDMNRCIGCNACVLACQSENNIPVVGRDNVIKGREMHWLRIDRYYKGSSDEPEVSFQPMTCQQCENAPCEEVCPVGATLHSQEGLNEMTYNRCIGTRYCSNNCPYKVRRFNFFNYHLDTKQERNAVKKMVFNPEVTVRARGVMEKCSFCVQRIQRVKIKAKNARRPIRDGEIRTACQQTCPTEAIVFGDLNDPASQLSRLHALPRAYKVLEELNNRPRIAYLARVRNPHPELV